MIIKEYSKMTPSSLYNKITYSILLRFFIITILWGELNKKIYTKKQLRNEIKNAKNWNKK